MCSEPFKLNILQTLSFLHSLMLLLLVQLIIIVITLIIHSFMATWKTKVSRRVGHAPWQRGRGLKWMEYEESRGSLSPSDIVSAAFLLWCWATFCSSGWGGSVRFYFYSLHQCAATCVGWTSHFSLKVQHCVFAHRCGDVFKREVMFLTCTVREFTL